MSDMLFFILRMPMNDTVREAPSMEWLLSLFLFSLWAAKGRVPVKRLQLRALHAFSQMAEDNLSEVLVEEAPLPSAEDTFHPLKV